MSDEYKLRKDIDRAMRFLNNLEYTLTTEMNISLDEFDKLINDLYEHYSNVYTKEESDEVINRLINRIYELEERVSELENGGE